MWTETFPRMYAARQVFPVSPPLDIRARLEAGLVRFRPTLRRGMTVAVAVGSRGITDLPTIVAAVLEHLRAAGTEPFIVPAMGSHGGATAEGQTELLAEYGLTASALGVPVRAGMAVERLGTTPEGVAVWFSAEALRADGIVLINRIKPHTDFRGEQLGSGLLKMLAVGLGKQRGAATYHAAASRLGYEPMLCSMGRLILQSAPILAGVALIEDQSHSLAELCVLGRDEIEAQEPELFARSRQLMPALPLNQVDLLIVDRIGKNISGTGLDPNITGRWVHGYSSLLQQPGPSGPFVRRLLARELTPETRGNAIGVGLADLVTTRLARAIDLKITALNSLTALTPQCAKVPIQFETDREAIAAALTSLALPDPAQARVIRIRDTLSLEHLELSEACLESGRVREGLVLTGGPVELRFDAAGNLAPLGDFAQSDPEGRTRPVQS